MKHAPSFWFKKDSKRAALLSPLSWVYALAHALHQKSKKTYISALPVICVGNATVGGNGKTPAVHALIPLLKNHGLCTAPVILMRGYGGRETGPLLVDPNSHNSALVGDEAMMSAAKYPVIISADRAAGAKLAEEHGFDLIIMDDGLQNPGLHKDFVLLVVDGVARFGNQKLLPAGPLRAPLKETLKKIDTILSIGDRFDDQTSTKSVFSAHFTSDKDLSGQKIIAFAGIGRPDKVKATLQQCGAEIIAFHGFPDHHPYKDEELESMKTEAKEKDAILITTEKDYMRIPDHKRSGIDTLPVHLQFDQDISPLLDLIEDRIA